MNYYAFEHGFFHSYCPFFTPCRANCLLPLQMV
jgi:hypothetical protein